MSHCTYGTCKAPLYSKDLCHYGKPVALCWDHHWHLNELMIGSAAEAVFLWKCGIVRHDAMEKVVDSLMEIL